VSGITESGMNFAMDDQETALVKRSARRFATRWARQHPKTVAKAAGTVASHPVRTVRLVGHARQANEVARDPRAAPAASRGFGAVRDAGRAELTDPELWRVLGETALTLAAVYDESRRRRTRRRRITRVVVGVAALAVVSGGFTWVTSRRASGT